MTRTALGALLGLLLAACSGGTDPTRPQLTINTPSASLEVGGSVQLAALGAEGAVSWTTSNSSVATVVSTGFVTAVGPGTATITATTPSQSASTTITVQPPPSISLASATASFSARQGGANPAAQSIAVSNAGPGTLQNLSVASVTYGSGQPTGWLLASLSASSAAAGSPASLQLSVNSASLAVGAYSATVSISASPAGNSPQAVAVSLVVSPPPTIELSSVVATFAQVSGASPPSAQIVAVASGASDPVAGLTTSVSYDQPAQSGWLSVGLNRAFTPADITLQTSAGTRPAGTYTATVTVASPIASNSPRTIAVTFVVAPPPRLDVSVNALNFTAPAGGPDPAFQNVLVTNGGGGGNRTFQIEAQYSGPNAFLELQAGSAATPHTLRVQPRVAGLAPGVHTATLRLTDAGASNGPQTIAVTLTVGDAPTIALTTSTVNFSALSGGSSPTASVVGVNNATSSAVTGLVASVEYVTGSGWLAAALGASVAPTSLTLTPTIAGLSVGTYTANVRIASSVAGNSPQTVVVTLTIQAPTSIAVSTTPYVFAGTTVSSPAAQLRTVDNGGGGTLSSLSVSVLYAGTGGWLSASLSGGTAPANLTVQPSSTGLAVGTYNATVRIASFAATNSPVLIPVTFTVGASPKIGTDGATRTVLAGQGNGITSVTPVNITNVGAGMLTGLSVSVTYLSGPQNGWLQASLGTTTAPALLGLSANAGTSGTPRPLGTYTARVRISSGAADNSPQDVIVTFTVGLSLANSGVWSSIYPTYCSGCHFSGGSSPNLSSADAFYNNTVNVNNANPRGGGTDPLAVTYPKRVVPGNHLQSYLYYEINWSAGAFRMPTGAQMPVGTRDLFRDWINSGAHP